MCCFVLAVGFFGPRLGFLIFWLLAPVRVNTAFDTVIWPLLGLIFVPWATLAYVLLFPVGGALEWAIVIAALVLDLATLGGGGLRRKQVPGYPDSAP